MQFRVQRAIERPLTPSQSSDRRIDVHVIFKRFQPYPRGTVQKMK